MAVISLGTVVYASVRLPYVCKTSMDFKVSFPTLYLVSFEVPLYDITGGFVTKHFFVSMIDDSTCNDLIVDGKDIFIRYNVEDSRIAEVANLTYVRVFERKEDDWKVGTLDDSVQGGRKNQSYLNCNFCG